MNPFLISGYESPKYFCDRKIEAEKIVNILENSRNLTLIINSASIIFQGLDKPA